MGRKEQLEELLNSLGDQQVKKYRAELSKFLEQLPIDINEKAMDEYRQHVASSSARQAAVPTSPRTASEGGGGKEIESRRLLHAHLATAAANAHDPENPAWCTIPLPSLVDADLSSPRKKVGMRKFHHAPSQIPLGQQHGSDAESPSSASAAKCRLPKKPLAAVYQQRVSPRIDPTRNHIFAGENAVLRDGFTSVETRPTKKHMWPIPVCAPFSLVDISVPYTAPQPPSGSSRRANVGGGDSSRGHAAGFGGEGKMHSTTTKVRETTMYTGKAIPTAEARRIPPLQDRFEASYAPLYANPNLILNSLK